MRVYISQIYAELGATFPFSHHFQIWLGQEIERRVESSEEFEGEYGSDFEVMFRISARSNIPRPVLEGPKVYRRSREIEFVIFLPFDATIPMTPQHLADRLAELLEAIAGALGEIHLASDRLIAAKKAILAEFLEHGRFLKNARSTE